MNDDTPQGDRTEPPFTLEPDRDAEARGELRCFRCGAPATWHPWAGAWAAACQDHSPEDDWT